MTHIYEYNAIRKQERERLGKALQAMAMKECRYDTEALEMWSWGMWQAIMFVLHACDEEIDDAVKTYEERSIG